MGAQGIRLNQFVDLEVDPVLSPATQVVYKAEEIGTPIPDPIFKDAAGNNVRQVTRRNTPTYINAALFFTSFHDGRANNVFNGANNWGPADNNAVVFAVDGLGKLVTEKPGSASRPWLPRPWRRPSPTWRCPTGVAPGPRFGKKMLSLKPLAKQKVHGNDSVFGSGDFSSLYTFRDPLGNVVNIPLGLGIVNTTTPDPVTLKITGANYVLRRPD